MEATAKGMCGTLMREREREGERKRERF